MGTWNTWLRRFLLGALLLGEQTIVNAAADSRDQAHLQRWVAEHKQERAIAAFEENLQQQDVHNIVPIHQLLRTASDWRKPQCVKVKAQPFAIPEKEKWVQTVKSLKFVHMLREKGILPAFEVVSVYRNASIDDCADGKGIRHPTAGAFDLVVSPAEGRAAVKRLCDFFWKEGSKHQMGFSQYPSGRLHIDTVRHNTWGKGGRTSTSVCIKRKGPSPSPQR